MIEMKVMGIALDVRTNSPIVVLHDLDLSRKSLIDIGTGAGFPGIPIKILFPEIEVLLLDSLQKRITFLQDVVNTLELSTISCIHGRAEELSVKPAYRETFDFAVKVRFNWLSAIEDVVFRLGEGISLRLGDIAFVGKNLVSAEIEKFVHA